MQPAEALRRIAYLLEAEAAETYKVQAFRRAAATVDGVAPAELSRLDEQGRLETLAGVGKSTAEVISEALSGAVPRYLQDLQQQGLAPPSGPVGKLLKSLRGDCHSHSNWSDGGSPIEEVARWAAELGHEYLVLTDHSPRLTVAHGLDRERLLRQLDVVAEVNESLAPFRLLTGIEVDILEDGSLDQDDDLLARLDLVVASVHSKLRMESQQMTARMVRAIESPHSDVLGHCTGRMVLGRGRPQSTFDAEAVFAACAATGTAVEINSRPERRDPPRPLLEAALAAGCVFSIDTDAHAPGQLEWLRNGCEQAAEAGVPPGRVVNTGSVAELLAWTASHAS
ncbi:MAG TPA: PHP domain-containing protein [Acidimicrobiales bacterium]|nr:PHP domain-containing protein [Acidimicrobiales bacterium]